jgi:hypothetical protein
MLPSTQKRERERKGFGRFSNYIRKPSAVARIHYHPCLLLPAVYKKSSHFGEKNTVTPLIIVETAKQVQLAS